MFRGLSENVLSVEFFGIIIFICYHPKCYDYGFGCHSSLIQYYTFSFKFFLY